MMRRFFQFLRDMPLRKKLYLSFTVLVLLPVMTFSGFVLYRQQQYMVEKTNTYFADSVTQLALRMDHDLEEYENALQYIALNRQILGTFDVDHPSYYQQYDAMKNVLEPMLMMVDLFLPSHQEMGIYTDNRTWRERGTTFMYVDAIREKTWYPQLVTHHGVFWTGDGENVAVLLRMLRSSVHAPVNYTFIRIDPSTLVAAPAEPLSAHSLYLLSGEDLVYSEHTADTALEMDGGEDGLRSRNGRTYIQVRRRLETNGWTLCVCCPYDGHYAGTVDIVFPLVFLALGNLLVLLAVGYLIARSLSSRIDRLNASISRAAEGDLTEWVGTHDRDEIGVLTNHYGEMLKSLREHIRINYENKIQLRESELKALQAQINPHFLYNTLSMINWMAIEHNALEISDIVCSLSNFYRAVLNQGDPITTVEGEMENVRAYLRIQSCMHDDSFIVEMHIPDEILHCRMIGIVFQPIIENAIEHGLDQRTEETGARLTVEGHAEGDDLLFSITDNGPGITQEQFTTFLSSQGKGYGLKNVQNRLKIAYGENYGLSMDPDVAEGTRILIRIPRIPEN